MHLNNRPVYFVKGSRRKAAYYTVHMRELIADGWTQEQEISSQPEAIAPEHVASTVPESLEEAIPFESTEEELIEEEEQVKGIDQMTKAELIVFAQSKGVEFKQYATKSDIIEACLAAQNG
jgi:hypothetical protein